MTGEKYSALRPIGGTEKRVPKKVRHHLGKGADGVPDFSR